MVWTSLDRLFSNNNLVFSLSTLALHFKRPSPYCQIWPTLQPDDKLAPISASLSTYKHRLQVSQAVPVKSGSFQAIFEKLLPEWFEMPKEDERMTLASAQSYLALHPLLKSSSSELYFLSSESDDSAKERLLTTMANAASTVIDNFVDMYEGGNVLSIWVFTEQVLEGGVVLARTLITLKKFPCMLRANFMASLLKVNRLLLGCAERWEGGSVHSKAWEALLPILWAMLDKS
jgi:hypothetical protein